MNRPTDLLRNCCSVSCQRCEIAWMLLATFKVVQIAWPPCLVKQEVNAGRGGAVTSLVRLHAAKIARELHLAGVCKHAGAGQAKLSSPKSDRYRHVISSASFFLRLHV